MKLYIQVQQSSQNKEYIKIVTFELCQICTTYIITEVFTPSVFMYLKIVTALMISLKRINRTTFASTQTITIYL